MHMSSISFGSTSTANVAWEHLKNNRDENKRQRRRPPLRGRNSDRFAAELFPPEFEQLEMIVQRDFSSWFGAGGTATQRSRKGRGEKRPNVAKRRFHMGGMAAKNTCEVAARRRPVTRAHRQQSLVA